MYDIVFENGLVIDTVAKSSRTLNVGIKNGKIAEVSTRVMPAERVIDAEGLIVSPGFVDVHSHIDGNSRGARLSALQGITTVVSGNCGLSPINTAEHFEMVRAQGLCVNEAMLIGHSFSLREAVGIASPNDRANAAQVDKMVLLARQALESGALGISLGLDYSPGASSREIDAMAEICGEYNALFPVHTRLFTQYDLYSIYEILAAAKKHSLRLLLSHYVYQYSGFGSMHSAIDIVRKARAAGLNVFIDSGMYSDWATYIGTATFDEQTIADNALRFGSMVCATGKYSGQRLNRELYTLLREKYPSESVICFSGTPDEVAETLMEPYAMPSTDAGVYAPREGHPQIAGTFPKYFRKLVRERRLLSLYEAVYKATLLPCEVLRLKNKGVIAEGFDADITLFSFEEINDNAHFPGEGLPDAPPDGIPYVMVNGELVIDDYCSTSHKSGKIISALESQC